MIVTVVRVVAAATRARTLIMIVVMIMMRVFMVVLDGFFRNVRHKSVFS